MIYGPDKKIYIILLLMISGVAGFLVSWVTRSQMGPSPFVPVRETVHYPVSFVKQLKNSPDAGRKIFNEFCAACHGSNPPIDVHAPRVKDCQAWEMRLRQGKVLLLKHTILGKGAMPARGGCFECSDIQLQAAVDFLIKNCSSQSENKIH